MELKRELLRLARKIIESDRIALVDVHMVGHSEAVTFHNDKERTITVHASNDTSKDRKYMVLLYRHDGKSSDDVPSLYMPDYEVFERAGLMLLEEAQRMRKESGW